MKKFLVRTAVVTSLVAAAAAGVAGPGTGADDAGTAQATKQYCC